MAGIVSRGLLPSLVALAPGLACRGGASGDGEGTATEGTGAATDIGDETQGEPDPAQCEAIAVPTLDEPGARVIERIAEPDQIPGLADQPTTHGRILGTLFAFDGRLHLGYGDYSDNTGPITMSAWDPGMGGFVDLGVLPTEEVLWFRPGPGTLYSPAIDPDGHQEEGGIYRLDCGAAGWHVGTPIEGAVHVYDVARQGGLIYAGTGSLDGQPARLMSSPDHGESWTEVLRHESPAGRFSRFYFVGATEDRLLVSGREHPDPDLALAWVREAGGGFVPIADPPTGLLVPIVLGDAMVVVAFSSNPGRGSALGSYRIEGDALVEAEPWPTVGGEAAQLVAWAPQGADPAHAERLLVLMRAVDGSHHVLRTDDLELGAAGFVELAVLEPLADGDEPVSMALLLGDLYLGTRRGALDVLRELEAPAG